MNPDVKYKQCTKCGRLLQVDAFRKGRSECKQCLKAYCAAYRAAHLEEQRAYRAAHREEQRAYYAAHREEIRARRAAYRAAHREEQLTYRSAHREEIRARCAAYRAAKSNKIPNLQTINFLQTLNLSTILNTKS